MGGSPVALVTGASRGIGRAIALMLAKEGYRLVLTGRDQQALAHTQQQAQQQVPSASVTVLAGDVTQPAFCQQVVQVAVHQYGRLDVLVNNAGIGGKIGLLTEVPDEQIVAMVATNLTAPMLLAKYALVPMVQQQSGTILHINSVAGKTAFPFWAVYDASKAGLKAFTEALLEEQRTNGVRVVGIYPGATETAIWDSLDLQQAPDKTGFLRPEAVADAVRYVLAQPPGTLVADITITPTQPAL